MPANSELSNFVNLRASAEGDNIQKGESSKQKLLGQFPVKLLSSIGNKQLRMKMLKILMMISCRSVPNNDDDGAVDDDKQQ